MVKRPGFLKRGERVRLQTFLARSGIASRRAAEEMITHGRIAVNGETVTAMGLQVVPGVDRVEVDGEEVKVAPTTWIALHKPTGYVTTRQDPFGRETVYALLPEKYHGLFHVGRLDRDSEGLLLLTNDGDLANRFLHPSFGITKEYDVIVAGKPTDAALRQLVEGVELEDGIAKAESAKLIGPAGNGQSRLKMVLREGKKREVRRMLDALGHEVVRLVRRRFGPIDLAELPQGKWRVVAPEELAHVRDPGKHRAPARESHGAYDRDDEKPRAKAAGDAKKPAVGAKKAAGVRSSAFGAKPSAGSRKVGAGAGKDDAPRARPGARDEERRPRGKSFDDERKPARPAVKSARSTRADEEEAPRKRPPAKSTRSLGFDAGEAPPRKRPPTGGRFASVDDWGDAPRVREDAEDRAPARGGRGERDLPAGARGGSGRPERAGARGKGAGDRKARPGAARGGFEREDRPAAPRAKAGDREERRPGGARGRSDRAGGRSGGARGGFEREDRPAARGKAGDREERRPSGARGGSDRAGGRAGGARGGAERAGGRAGGARGGVERDSRPPRRDHDEERGGSRERDERRPAGARGGSAGARGRGAGGPPARGGRFDREERGVRPPSPRDRAPAADEEVDELDAWGTAPRRSSGARGGAAGARRGGPPARGARGGGGSGGRGGRPGGKPGGGRPGGARGGGGKPRRPGGGGGRRGR